MYGPYKNRSSLPRSVLDLEPVILERGILFIDEYSLVQTRILTGLFLYVTKKAISRFGRRKANFGTASAPSAPLLVSGRWLWGDEGNPNIASSKILNKLYSKNFVKIVVEP